MFSLPQPSHEDSPACRSSSIDLPEESVYLRAIFSLIYPIKYKIPDTFSLSHLFGLLLISDKYDLEAVTIRTKKRLWLIVESGSRKPIENLRYGFNSWR